MKNYEELVSLPLTPKEKEELTAALDRRYSLYWVKAREELKELCENRITEKEEKKLQYLLTGDKVNHLVPIDDVTLIYIEELWNLGYSSGAIAKGLRYAVSPAVISQKFDPVTIRKRGQVIELLEDFGTDFDLEKWRLSKSYNYKQGPKVTEEEKRKFREMFSKGYSISYIAKVTGRSENAVRKWVKV